MKSLLYSLALSIILTGAWAATTVTSQTPARARQRTPAAADTREGAYRANNLGVALLEQFKYKEGAEEFRRALRLDPKLALARINLAIALAAEPYNGTALYNLGTALLRAGQREEGQRVIARFQELRQLGSATTLGQNYMEQGRYAEAVASAGAEPDLVDRRTPEVVFKDVTAAAKIPRYPYLSKSAAFVDYDHDGDLDIFIAGGFDASKALKDEAEAKRKEEASQSSSVTDIPLNFNLPLPVPSLLLRNNGYGTFQYGSVAYRLSELVRYSAL